MERWSQPDVSMKTQKRAPYADAGRKYGQRVDSLFIGIGQRRLNRVLFLLKKEPGGKIGHIHAYSIPEKRKMPDNAGLVHEKRGVYKTTIPHLKPCNAHFPCRRWTFRLGVARTKRPCNRRLALFISCKVKPDPFKGELGNPYSFGGQRHRGDVNLKPPYGKNFAALKRENEIAGLEFR